MAILSVFASSTKVSLKSRSGTPALAAVVAPQFTQFFNSKRYLHYLLFILHNKKYHQFYFVLNEDLERWSPFFRSALRVLSSKI